MKREISLLYIPMETEIAPNSKIMNDLRNEELSNSDIDDKSLLSVRISHDDMNDNENGLLYQMNEVSKRQIDMNNNTMESMLNASSKRNKKEIIVSELNIELNSTEKKKKTYRVIFS